MTAPESPRASGHLSAIANVCGAVACFAVLDTTTKYCAAHLPVAQVTWARYLAQLVLMIVLLGPRWRLRLVRTRKPALQLGRGVLMLGSTTLAITGYSLLPLADAMAIGFLTPVLVTLLAVPILGEAATGNRLAAAAIGFAGVLLVVRPGFAEFGWGAVAMLAMALVYALYQVLTRQLGPDENPVSSLFLSALVGTALASLAVPLFWTGTWPSPLLLALLVLAGLLGGVGHFFMIRAYARAPAGLVAPYTYSALIWAVGLGWLVFGDFPDAVTLVGMAVIVAAGIYLSWSEQRRRT